MELHMDNTSLTDKIKMAQGFLDSAQLLERTLNQVVAKSQEEAESKVEDTRYTRKMTAHFLYAVVFELCIKIIWEIEHNASPKPNHDILSRYRELSKESRQAISDMYDTQVKNTENTISHSNSGVRDNKGDVVNLCIQLQSLQDALKSNPQTMKDFKYEGRLTGKSSAFGSIMWSTDRVYILPNPEFIVFPEQLLTYAISLNRK